MRDATADALRAAGYPPARHDRTEGHGRRRRPRGRSPRDRARRALRWRPGTSCTSWAAWCAISCWARLRPAPTSTSRPTPRPRRPRGSCAAGPTPSTSWACGSGRWVRARAAAIVEITTFRAGGLRGGASQARRDVREGHPDRPVAPRLHDQRDGDASCPAGSSSIRTAASGTWPSDPRHAAGARGRVLRRPAAHAARRAVRRAARDRTPAAARRGRDRRRCASDCRS